MGFINERMKSGILLDDLWLNLGSHSRGAGLIQPLGGGLKMNLVNAFP